MMINLRDYQEDGAQRIRERMRAKAFPVLFVLPTGAGKTYTFSYIADSASRKGNRVIIIVHRKELLTQASASLRNLGVQHGLISPHFTPDFTKFVQVASVDTLLIRVRKHPERYRPDLIIFDEAHHVIENNKWGDVYELLGRPPMLGVTATPVRTDGTGLGVGHGGIFKSMVLGPMVPELIRRGMLIDPDVYTSIDLPDTTGLSKNKDGDWNQKALAERTDKPAITGSAVEQYKKICPGAKAIVFCVNVTHAKHVVQEFNSAGFRFALLVGQPEMSDRERSEVNAKLRSGELDGAVTVDLVSEGYDLPDLSCCIMLRRTESESLFLQQAGRVMRPAEGKTQCWLLDHVGNVGATIDGEFVRKHGLPNEEREWSLEGRKKSKGRKKDAIPTLKLIQCKGCFMMFDPAPACPGCGKVVEAPKREIETVDGELTMITPEMKAAISAKKKAEVKSAKTLEELERIGAERGYSPGWARATWEAKRRIRGRFTRRPPAPPQEELRKMSLQQLEAVAAQQGWPHTWPSDFYHKHQRGAQQ